MGGLRWKRFDRCSESCKQADGAAEYNNDGDLRPCFDRVGYCGCSRMRASSCSHFSKLFSLAMSVILPAVAAPTNLLRGRLKLP